MEGGRGHGAEWWAWEEDVERKRREEITRKEDLNFEGRVGKDEEESGLAYAGSC